MSFAICVHRLHPPPFLSPFVVALPIYVLLLRGEFLLRYSPPLASCRGTFCDCILPSLFNLCSDIGDEKLEVVGLENTLFVSQIIVGVRAHGLRLAQCSSVVIRWVSSFMKVLMMSCCDCSPPIRG